MSTSKSIPLDDREAMNQEKFTCLYDRLWKFAYVKAGRYFRDFVLREDAASEAVNLAVDGFIDKDCCDEETARRTIESSLRLASRHREVEPVPVKEEGFHGYKLVS